MDGGLLHVITFTARTQAQAEQALRDARRLMPRAGDARRTLLLFCDLPDAPGERMPQDDPLIRLLQSGAMAADARRPGRVLLLVRRRSWSDAARAYLGEGQAPDARAVVAGLLSEGRTPAVFDAATFSPASLRGQYAAVLFSPLSLCCTPDTPTRMLELLPDSPCGCVCAPVLARRDEPPTPLAQLAELGFSLSPLRLARDGLLARRGLAPTDGPILCTPCALGCLPPAAPVAPGCPFVPRERVSLGAMLAAWHAACMDKPAWLPIAQLALILAAAALGMPALALLAVAAPELWALAHPRLLPGALMRLALLPLTAGLALDALLCRALARSRRLRLRVPDALLSANGCVLAGVGLLAAAISGVHALAPLLPAALLWLSAPLLLPALDAPTRERIPLSAEQAARLQSLAEGAFYDALPCEAPPALAMLAACAGCMLGQLEPDEAARRAQAQLSREIAAQTPDVTAAGQAALLVCAQYLRERMGACDAALRSLPAQLESRALSLPGPRGDGLLPAFLRAARAEDASPESLRALARAGRGEPLDALFLPPDAIRAAARHPVTLPLTHPHTFLLAPPGAEPPAPDDPNGRFLCLSAAALGHPFYALLMRSPVAAPYAALLVGRAARADRP